MGAPTPTRGAGKPGHAAAPRRFAAAAWLLVFVLAIALRVPYLRWQVLNPDEAVYAAVAETTAAGNPLYRAAVDVKPPLIYALYGTVFDLLGPWNLAAVHVTACLWAAATALLAGLAAWRLLGRDCAIPAAALYAVFSMLPEGTDMAAANAELFMAPLIIAAVVAFWRGLHEDRTWWLFASGILCGLAALFKYPALATLGTFGSLLSIDVLARRSTPGRAAAAFAITLAGCCLPLGLACLFFTREGSLPAFLFWTVRYGMLYTGQVGVLQKLLSLFAMLAAHFIPAAPLVWGSLLLALLSRQTRGAPPGRLLLWLWFIWSLAGAASGGRLYFHYYIQALAPLCIIAADGLLLLRRFLARTRLPARCALACLLAAALLPSAWNLVEQASAPPRVPGRRIAAYVAANSRPSDTLFVWGFLPEVYVLSRRRMATPFPTTDLVVGISAGAPAASRIILPALEQTVLASLSGRPPLFIVDTAPSGYFGYDKHPMSRFPAIEQFVHETYREAATLERSIILRRQ